MKKVINSKKRCFWVSDHPLYIAYHDEEWGVPIYDDQVLFEFLILEGMQAGLSWLTILKRRAAYRRHFNDFKAELIAKYDQKKVAALLKNQDIIRHKLKILSVINNAKAYLQLQKEWGSFSKYIWQFVDGHPLKNAWKTKTDVPTKTAISDKMAKDLKKHGFQFVGSTICYAFMQAVGMVNDHTVQCFRYREVNKC